MKKIAVIIPFIALAVTAIAQGQIEYFDKNWQPVAGKNNAAYYKVIQYDSTDPCAGQVRYYYITGQLEREANICGIDKSGKENINGWCTWYYINGSKWRLSYFSRGSLDSATWYWNEDGSLDRVQHYQKNVLQGDWVCYNPDGSIKYVAVYEKGKVGKFTFYEKDTVKVINSGRGIRPKKRDKAKNSTLSRL